jgi:hypothetical protein
VQGADAGRIVGDITPLDFPVLTRAMTLRATLFMTDDYIYRQIFAGGRTAASRRFSSQIMKGDIDFRAYSPVGITAAPTQNYALQVLTDDSNVNWSLQGPVDVRPGNPLMLTLVGAVQRPPTFGKEYAMIRLQNGITSTYPYLS